MTPWEKLLERIIRAGVHCLLKLGDLVFGVGDLPDDRPATPNFIDYEYFEMLDKEGQS